MEPRQAADLIGRNHTVLREMLDDIERLIDRVVAEDAGASTAFFEHCDALCRMLLVHIDLEDAVFVPVLRAHHPEGEHEASELLRHHEAQRRWLVGVLTHRGGPPAGDTLRSVRALAHVLRVDMDHEDAELAKLCR